jgi:hypothetical protein
MTLPLTATKVAVLPITPENEPLLRSGCHRHRWCCHLDAPY